MLRKALTLGMVVIFGLSLLAVSMITCFTYDAEADPPGPGHAHYDCSRNDPIEHKNDLHAPEEGEEWCCTWKWMTND